MDHEYEKGSGSVDPGGECPGTVAERGARFREPKSCTDCRTTKTPLWRGGPSGPKSLCNACGIRYRKRRRELLGLQGQDKGKQGRRPGSENGVISVMGLRRDAASLKRRALIQLVKQRCRWRPLGEVEEAAVLLVALSSGFLCAEA